MPRSALRSCPAALLLLGLPLGAASAAPKPQAFASTATVAPSERVTVPLVDCADGSLRPCVWVAYGEGADQRLLLALEIGSDEVYLNDGAVTAAGGALKGAADAPLRTATLPKLTVGGLALSDVVVANKPAHTLSAPLPGDGGAPYAAPVGYLGLGALRGVAWAILPSKGEVVFAPAAEGAALVSGLGGAPLPLGRSAGGVLHRPGGKSETDAGRALALVKIGDKDVKLGISTFEARTTIERELLPAGPVAAYGDRRAQPVQIGVGGAALSVVLEHNNELPVLRQFEKNDLDTVTVGLLGADALGGLDLAFDPTAGTLAVKAGGPRVAAAPFPVALEIAEAALKKAQEAPPAEGAAAPAADLPKGTAAAWATVARARQQVGDLRGAADAWAASAALAPKDCDAQLQAGRGLLAVGEPAAAAQRLEAGATLWHAWGDLAVEVRAELKKALEHAEKDGVPFHFNGEEFGFVKVADVRSADVRMGAPAPRLPADGAEVREQAASCFVVDGHLAAADLLMGRAGAPEARYGARLDLDATLPLVAGNARLAAKDAPGAAAAYRQAILRDHAQGARPALHHLGLALALAAGGDAAGGAALAEAAALRAPEDAVIAAKWSELAIAAKDAGALGRARDRAAARPDLIAPQLAHLQLAAASGDGAAQGAARAALRATLDRRKALGQLHPAEEALAYAALGEVAPAEAAAAAALKARPADALTHVAQAAAAMASGAAPAAEAAARQAQRLDPLHPGLVR